jgi:ribosomal protein S18 acetylase RimI-like enzyme
MIRYTHSIEDINWKDAVEVIERAPLGAKKRTPLFLEKAFKSSFISVYVFDSEKLIGLGRALCDGVYQAAIYDVVLLPEYQGKGIGKEMVTRLCNQLPEVNIILYSVPGREGFYEKCGFKKMRTAMAKMGPSYSNPESGYLFP